MDLPCCMRGEMLLVVDVRNRDTAFGLVDGAKIVDRWEVRTADRTRDEWILLIRSLIRTSGGVPTSAILASVVPEATRVLRGVLLELSGTEPLVVGPGLKTGLAIDLDNARDVGADRVASAVGAIERHGAPAIVVGLGSVTTVDVIDGRQRFHGGAISVGVGVAAEALVTSTASLRRVELVAPSTAIGRNTVEAVQSGIVLGFAGLVDGLVSRIVGEMDERPTVVATGVFASLLGPLCASIDVVDEELTLWGLVAIDGRNR